MVFTWAEWVRALVLMEIWSWEKPLVLIDRINLHGYHGLMGFIL